MNTWTTNPTGDEETNQLISLIKIIKTIKQEIKQCYDKFDKTQIIINYIEKFQMNKIEHRHTNNFRTTLN